MVRHLLASFAIVVAVGACSSSSTDAPDQQWAIVQDHIFISHLPRNQRDMVKDIAFIDHEDAGKIGIRGMTSQFRFFIDVFTWKRNGSRVASKILQTNQDVQATFRAWKCKRGEAPRDLDLCLELREGDKQPRKYFSRHDWIIEDASKSNASKLNALIGDFAMKLPIDPDAPAPIDDDDVVDLPVDMNPITE